MSGTAGPADDPDVRVAALQHQLKSALTVIAGWARNLDDRWDELDEAHRREGIAAIRRRADAMALDAERMLAELRGRPSSTGCDLTAVALDVVGAYGAAWPDHHIRYVGPDHLVVDVDVTTCRQIVSHLVENAVRYSPPGPVRVVCGRTAGGALLAVTDQGPGLPDHVDPFEGSPVPVAASNGTGLGLYIVRRVVEAAGGSITAHRNPQRGATFVVTLPGSEART